MLTKETLFTSRSKYLISTSASNGSVSVSPSGKQYKGTIITVTLTPNTHYQFSSLSIQTSKGTSVNYTTVTSGSKYTFKMPGDNVTVTAVFSAMPTYTVSIGSFANGSVRANKTSGIYAGETITLTATPNQYYTLSSISVSPNASLSGSGNTRTFVMPANNVSVSASFLALFNITCRVDDISPKASWTDFIRQEAISLENNSWDLIPGTESGADTAYCIRTRTYKDPLSTIFASLGKRSTFNGVSTLTLYVYVVENGWKVEKQVAKVSGTSYVYYDYYGSAADEFIASSWAAQGLSEGQIVHVYFSNIKPSWWDNV